MDIIKVINQRKENIIRNVNLKIQRNLIEYGWKETTFDCPEDLYKDLKSHFESKGFKIWREKFEYSDFEGCGTGEYGYNFYVGL